ncbi:unnamed protein product [Miscanthus lutarioriparius]|uniref:CCHC-type domain-containing protein n=1 Tax=Miscanthus lutarioriparius TaxID=422564 RepID=A0A811S8G3_9POAL|nr:unnamed protein product [Miscanthus lutarioriparius]
MLRGVPQEMHSMLLNKKTAKEDWEAIKMTRLGADRVKEVNAQKLLAEFEAIAFKPGETIDDFAIRSHGSTWPRGGNCDRCTRVAIEMFKDLKNLTIEELIGHLRAVEERFEPMMEQVTEKAEKLLLTEEEWAEKNKSRMVSESSTSTAKGGGGGGHLLKKEKHWRRKNNGSGEGCEPKLMSMGTPRRKGKCRKCGVYGHWGKECKKAPLKER